jgi:hypothetical protein
LTSTEYLSLLEPVELPRGSAAHFLSLHVHYDPYSATASADYQNLRDRIQEFDILGMLRDELTKGRVHVPLTRRLVAALQFMDEDMRWQAIVSLLENVDTLAPVLPQVLMAIKDCTDGLAPERVDKIHAILRGLIEGNNHSAQIDLNLAYMVRVLAQVHSPENEALLIRLYNGPHGFGSGPAPYIQRDIMLALTRWNVTYWLSDMKNYTDGMHPWVKRAFIICAGTLGDAGVYWLRANKRGFPPFDTVAMEWAETKRSRPNWVLPV